LEGGSPERASYESRRFSSKFNHFPLYFGAGDLLEIAARGSIRSPVYRIESALRLFLSPGVRPGPNWCQGNFYRAFTFYGHAFQRVQTFKADLEEIPHRQGKWSAFARHYLRNLGWFLFLRVT